MPSSSSTPDVKPALEPAVEGLDAGDTEADLHEADTVDLSTPMRRQYLEIKARYPGMILLFQIGDFFETFDEDAHLVARELGVALTRKWFGKTDVHPLAGVPVRAIESHLAKLIQRGYKVALCEQVTPPGKGLVERQVTRIITPGTVIEPGLLVGRANNYLAALVPGERYVGLAYADVSTGEFRVTVLEPSQARSELQRLAPAELVVPGALEPEGIEVRALTRLPADRLEVGPARAALLDHFQSVTLEPFGIEDEPLGIRAAAALIDYLRDTQPDALANLTRLQRYQVEAVMQLDLQTIRNLELFQGWEPGGTSAAGSLVATIDQTVTAMGGRMLRRWLRYPLLDLVELRARQEAVTWFVEREAVRATMRSQLETAGDIERILARVRRRLAVPAEVVGLSRSLRVVAAARSTLVQARAPHAFVVNLEPCDDLVELIEGALSDRPPADFERGGVMRAGFNAELDKLRSVLSGGRRFLAEFEDRERARSGIRSLKVGYNKVFGYYIEITRPNLRLAPKDYIRKQTLTNAERYFTLELKEHEALIANAKERILELETSLFRQLCEQVGTHLERLRRVADALARVDVFGALAEVAVCRGYSRPLLDDGETLEIVAGRHPIIDAALPPGTFVPNDTLLSRDAQIMLLTAPNMAGKSIYLRQVALICLLAQIGSYVPAESARIGLVDRVFTRIGLNEYGLRGQSSFMLEMIETAHILHHASARSLVLLDEVGRGTSTADGLAIARAVIEFLHNHPRAGARTLFATHYHELTACADVLPRVRNFHVAVAERDGTVEYLHRVEPGRAEKSFGLHVARLAGMPRAVLRRAGELLGAYGPEIRMTVERSRWERGRPEAQRPIPYQPVEEDTRSPWLHAAEEVAVYHPHEPEAPAYGFRGPKGAAQQPDPLTTPSAGEGGEAAHRVLPLLETLSRLDLDALSPIEALTQLYELQREARRLEELMRQRLPRH